MGSKQHEDFHLDESGLEEYVQKAKDFIENNPNINEQDTKTILVDPLIDILGWDKFKNEVKTEYPIQMGSRSHHVDYALKLEGVPAVLMEVKPLGKDLEQDSQQAISYGRVEDVKWVTLTNGEEIEIYNTEKGKKREQCLLTSLEIDDYLEEKDTLGKLLSKQAISEGRIDELDKKIRKKRRALRNLKKSKSELENELSEIIKGKVNDSLYDKIEESVPKLLEDLIERVEGKKEPEDKRAEEPKPLEEKNQIEMDLTKEEAENMGVTGKKPKYIEFGEEKIDIRYWTDVTKEISARVYEDVKDFSKAEEIEGSDRIYFSTDKDELVKPLEISNSPYYVEGHFSAARHRTVMSRLVRKFGYDEGQVKIILE